MNDKNTLEIKHFRIHEDSPQPLCVWSTGKYTLKVIYDINQPHLSSNFRAPNCQDMQGYINNDTENAFYSAIDKVANYCYQINIASNTHFYSCAGEAIYTKMLEIFLPIIKKFMVDALTDNLYIMEDGKLVKQ